MKFLKNDPWFKNTRQELRNNATRAEIALWEKLKGKKLGIKFRRQYSFGTYVIDFYCAAIKLGIEIDGGIHNTQKEKDDYRTRTLNQYGIRIIRFSNKEVMQDIDQVLSTINDVISPS